MMFKRTTSLLSATLLGLLVACGGSNNPAVQPETPVAPPAVAAKGFTYTDPQSAGWRLVKDTSSTSTRLVLNLVGPEGLKSRGLGFNLKAGAGATFGIFPNDWHAADTGVFELRNMHRRPGFEAPNPEPLFFAAGVKPGNVLTVGIFQKDRMIDARPVNKPVLQVALEFSAAAGLSVGDSVALAITKARMIPEDIGLITPDGQYDELEVMTKAVLKDIKIDLGTLKAQ